MFTKKDALAMMEMQNKIDKLSAERERAFIMGDMEKAKGLDEEIKMLESESGPTIVEKGLGQNLLVHLQAAHAGIHNAKQLIEQESLGRETAIWEELHELNERLGKLEQRVYKLR